jgi:hypothetical protein
MQQALMPQLRRARRCLKIYESKLNVNLISSAHTVDERVQDGHGTVGDTSVRVDLLEN